MSKWIFIISAFFVLSLPFHPYPLTDGDVQNWADVAQDIALTNSFLSGANDQGHGPLISWTSALFLKLIPKNFYMLNFFNLLCGLLCVYWMWFFSYKLWNTIGISRLATFFLSSSLVFVYLSRTPLYDWPATVFLFGFFGFYLLHISHKRNDYLLYAVVSVAIGSFSRFSICLGLGGIYVILLSIIFKRPFWLMVRDGIAVLISCLTINLPWFISQTDAHGLPFIKTFLYDNTGRYIKSTRVDSYYRKDFYGFTLYVLIGLLPHTFFLLASFSKKLLRAIRETPNYQALLAAFLPCLLLFSFSGHTKLARYIAYVFPPLILFLAHYVHQFGLKDPVFLKRCRVMAMGMIVFLSIVFTILLATFTAEAGQSLIFIFSLMILLYGLVGAVYIFVRYKADTLRDHAHRLLWVPAISYIIFFSVLAYESDRAEFLKKPTRMIERALEQPFNAMNK